MKNALLYIVTVLVWGSTWFAIEFQLGEVDVLASVTYRFVIAAILMWTFCVIAKVPMQFGRRDHAWIFLLACFNFGLNYATIYYSQAYLTSAMTSIAFSTMLLMNIFNTRLFFGKPISPQVWIGAFVGLGGIVALFWEDLAVGTGGDNSMFGLFLAILAALIASLGNMISVRNSQVGLNVFAVNAWGMLYGSLILAALVWVSGASFGFSTTPSYLISLLYLAVFGTVIAFASYYVLMHNIGPEKASYVIVLFPVVAVILSTLFEGFVWSMYTFAGFSLVLLGNAIILTPESFLRSRRQMSSSTKS